MNKTTFYTSDFYNCKTSLKEGVITKEEISENYKQRIQSYLDHLRTIRFSPANQRKADIMLSCWHEDCSRVVQVPEFRTVWVNSSDVTLVELVHSSTLSKMSIEELDSWVDDSQSA